MMMLLLLLWWWWWWSLFLGEGGIIRLLFNSKRKMCLHDKKVLTRHTHIVWPNFISSGLAILFIFQWSTCWNYQQLHLFFSGAGRKHNKVQKIVFVRFLGNQDVNLWLRKFPGNQKYKGTRLPVDEPNPAEWIIWIPILLFRHKQLQN